MSPETRPAGEQMRSFCLALLFSLSMLSSRERVSVRNLRDPPCWLGTVRASDLPRASSARCTVARWGRSLRHGVRAQGMMAENSGNRVRRGSLNRAESIKRPGDYARFEGLSTWEKLRDSSTGAREAAGEIKKRRPKAPLSSVQADYSTNENIVGGAARYQGGDHDNHVTLHAHADFQRGFFADAIKSSVEAMESTT